MNAYELGFALAMEKKAGSRGLVRLGRILKSLLKGSGGASSSPSNPVYKRVEEAIKRVVARTPKVDVARNPVRLVGADLGRRKSMLAQLFKSTSKPVKELVQKLQEQGVPWNNEVLHNLKYLKVFEILCKPFQTDKVRSFTDTYIECVSI